MSGDSTGVRYAGQSSPEDQETLGLGLRDLGVAACVGNLAHWLILCVRALRFAVAPCSLALVTDETFDFMRIPSQERSSWRVQRWRETAVQAGRGQANPASAVGSDSNMALDLTPEYKAKMTRRAIAEEEAYWKKLWEEMDGSEWGEMVLYSEMESKEKLCEMRAAVEEYEAEAARLSWARALIRQAPRRSAATQILLLVAALLCFGLLGLPFVQFSFSGRVNSFIDREISAIGLAVTGATLVLAPLIRRVSPGMRSGSRLPWRRGLQRLRRLCRREGRR